MYEGKKTYKLNSLLLDKATSDLLNEISLELGLRNTDFARLLLKKALSEIKAQGVGSYTLTIIGRKKKHG